MRELLYKMFKGWILHEQSYDAETRRYQLTKEEAMQKANGVTFSEASLLMLFGHWSNDIISVAAHYGLGLARRQPDGTLLYDDGTVDTLIKGGRLEITKVPPPPDNDNWYWHAGKWNDARLLP